VQPGNRVVGDERVGAPEQGEVVAQALGDLAQVHRGELVAHSDALVERSEDPLRSYRAKVG
jgi:hypothetical protein